MNKLVWMMHPFKGRAFDEPGLDEEIEKWIQEKYQQGYRICAMPTVGKWCFEEMDMDDGK